MLATFFDAHYQWSSFPERMPLQYDTQQSKLYAQTRGLQIIYIQRHFSFATITFKANANYWV
jgi:hypothetical protein